MLTEHQIVDRVQADTGLVKAYSGAGVQQAKIAEFTRRVAWALSVRGWGGVRKTSGENVHGLSTDKIIQRESGEVRDVVADADGATPRTAWTLVDHLPPADYYVAPQAELPSDPPPPHSQPDPPPVADPGFAEAINRLADDLEAIVEAVGNMTTGLELLESRLEQVQRAGVKVTVGL